MVKVIKFLIGFVITITIIVVGFCFYVINSDNSSNKYISMLNSLAGSDGVFTTLANVSSLMSKVDMETIDIITEIASDKEKVNQITNAISNIDTETIVEVTNIVKNIDPEIVSEFKDIVGDIDINSLTTATNTSDILEVVDLSTIVELTDIVSELDTQTKVDIQNQIDNVIQDSDVSKLFAQFLG